MGNFTEGDSSAMSPDNRQQAYSDTLTELSQRDQAGPPAEAMKPATIEEGEDKNGDPSKNPQRHRVPFQPVPTITAVPMPIPAAPQMPATSTQIVRLQNLPSAVAQGPSWAPSQYLFDQISRRHF